MPGKIHSDTLLMRAFAQTISLIQLISQVMKVTKKKRKVLATRRRRAERTRTIVLTDGPDNAAEHHLHGKWVFLLCGPPLQSICPWSCAALTFSSECQKSSESPCSPECLSHPAALQFSQELHFSLTSLTDIHLFCFSTVAPHADTPDT